VTELTQIAPPLATTAYRRARAMPAAVADFVSVSAGRVGDAYLAATIHRPHLPLSSHRRPLDDCRRVAAKRGAGRG
jgi:hypothetical protein